MFSCDGDGGLAVEEYVAAMLVLVLYVPIQASCSTRICDNGNRSCVVLQNMCLFPGLRLPTK